MIWCTLQRLWALQKRVRYRLDGSRIMRVYLDPKQRNSYAGVYKKLTGKEVTFEYPKLHKPSKQECQTSSANQLETFHRGNETHAAPKETCE
jgi:hypothetical protein